MTSTGLRYSYCSFLIANKVDIWAVSKLMGHKDIKQITQTYGHLIKEKADEENQKVRNFMGSLNENEKGWTKKKRTLLYKRSQVFYHADCKHSICLDELNSTIIYRI